MDSFQHQWNVSDWQATNPVLLWHFTDKLMLSASVAECSQVQPPKELTTEAISMIFVISIFIVFAALGSLITAYEFLYVENTTKKKESSFNKNYANKNLDQKDTKSTKDSTTVLRQNVMKKNEGNEENDKYFTSNKPPNDMEKSIKCKGLLRNTRSCLQCFCFIKNGKKFFQTDFGKEQFECFHGIKFFSNLLIIFYHAGFLFYLPTRRSLDEAKPMLQGPIAHFFFNATLPVDTFFVLSGFLNAYSFSKEYEKNNGKICWGYFYAKRFVRLTPVYLMVLGFHTTLFNYTGSGPIWPEYVTNPVCKETWWWYLLYINNFLSGLKMCMIWCWYLAADMQFYVVSPIFMLSFLRKPRFGYGLASATIFLSCLMCFLITKQYNLMDQSRFSFYLEDKWTFMNRIWLYFDKLYIKPYTRINSYLVGMLLGYYIWERKCRGVGNNWITLCCGWIVTGIFMWMSIFALFGREESELENALYHSVKNLFFSVGLSWIIYVCLTGQGGFINSFFSSKVFLPFSKLCYCAYLIHMIIIQRDYQAAQDVEEFSLLYLTLNILHVCFWTFVISIPVSLLFELPPINLLDLFIRKKKKLSFGMLENGK